MMLYLSKMLVFNGYVKQAEHTCHVCMLLEGIMFFHIPQMGWNRVPLYKEATVAPQLKWHPCAPGLMLSGKERSVNQENEQGLTNVKRRCIQMYLVNNQEHV